MSDEITATGAPEGASCARHPGVAAVMLCERCGSYCGVCCIEVRYGRACCTQCARLIPLNGAPGARVLAFLSDWILVGGAPWLVMPIRALIHTHQSRTAFGIFGLAWPIGVLVCNAAMSLRNGQTIGRWLCGLRVVSVRGEPASALQLAVGRFLPCLAVLDVASTSKAWLGLGLILLNLGVLMFARGGVSIIDRVSRTRVVRAEAG